MMISTSCHEKGDQIYNEENYDQLQVSALVLKANKPFSLLKSKLHSEPGIFQGLIHKVFSYPYHRAAISGCKRKAKLSISHLIF